MKTFQQWRILPFCMLVQFVLLYWSSAAPSTGVASDRFRVITYNVQFLPDPVSDHNERPDAEYRAASIAEKVSHFDVIALQETFNDTHRAIILDSLRQARSQQLFSVTSPTPEGFFTSGGCLLVSKTPLAAQHTMVFANYSKPIDYGLRADGFAAKGVLHARVQRDTANADEFVDVFVTHLEARDDKLRPLQYGEIAEFVKLHSDEDHPVLLLGDLNTRGGVEFRRDPQSQYSQLMRQLAGARSGRAWVDVWPHLSGDALGGTTEQESSDVGKRIDYVLLSNPPLPKLQLKPVATAVKLFQDDRVTALSDHNAVTAELEWQ